MTTELILNDQRAYGFNVISKQEAWLVVDGKPVCYMRLMEKDYYGGFVCLCTLETRKEFQRQGYATLMIRMVEEALGKKLASSDGFTPEGFAAVCGKIPMLPLYEAPTKPNFESMTFVEDWDKMHGPR